jgi:diguanylate cyclase (GGDEF)-like protein
MPRPTLDILPCILLFWLGLVAGPVSAVDLDSGWEYRWGDSPFTAAGVPVWTLETPEQSADDWQAIGFPSNPPGRDGRENVWFRTILPDGHWRDPVLYIFSVDLIVEVYIDGHRIYTYGQFDAHGKGRFEGWPWHMIALPEDSAGKPIYFRIFSDYMDIGLWGEVKLMERMEVLSYILGSSVERLITSGFSLLIALLSLVFALLRHEPRRFGAIALFALASGGMVLSGSQINLLLIDHALVWDYLGAGGYFLIPVAMALVLEDWLRPACSSLFKLVWRFHLLYLVGAIGLSATGVVSLASTYPVFDALFALTLALLWAPVVRFWKRVDSDQRAILVAYAVFSLLLLLDMAVAHSLLPWCRIPVAWGALAFSLAIVTISLRHYIRMQEALKAMNLVLEARVRQRTAELETLAARETERARFLTLENNKRIEIEDLISVLQDRRSLRESGPILSEALPGLCRPLGGAFYQFSATDGLYQLRAHWGDPPPTLPAEPIASRQVLDGRDVQCEPGQWCFEIGYQDPRQGEHILGRLWLHCPDGTPDDQRLTWRRLIERGVERINLTLSAISLHETLSQLSYEDGLTGLKNRRFLDEALAREIDRAQRQERPLSVLICDIDHFKRFNDTYGHEAGDTVIKTVAEHLAEVFRHTDIVCRYGGEEFVIVLPGALAEDCRQRAEALRARVAALDLQHEGQTLGSITLSAGIASWPEMIADPSELLTQADQALYRAKQAGRNRVERAA